MANQVLKGALHFPCMIIQNDQTGKGNQGKMQVAFSAKKSVDVQICRCADVRIV